MVTPDERSIEILLVEDNPADIRLTQEAFKEGKLSNRLSIVSDGEQALAYLNRKSPFEHAKRPDLILLDLNLPGKSGREVLADIKNNPKLRQIPVIMLTTSSAEEDIFKSYDLQVNCYITKPVDMERFITVIKAIDSFWFNIVRLPNNDDQ